MRHKYSTSSVVSGKQGKRLAFGKVSGIVTPADARRIIIDSPTWGLCEPLAQVVDYTGAVIAIGESALMASAILKARHGVPVIPTAQVVPAAHLRLMQHYCDASMGAGILRAVFSSLDEALRWAARQALVREHWLALRAGLRSAR